MKGDRQDAGNGVAWWNGLSESDRRYWLELAKSARPSDAWDWFKRARPDEWKEIADQARAVVTSSVTLQRGA
jgi:hypothetical protein